MSSSVRCGRNDSAAWSAAAPSSTVCTSWPVRFNTIARLAAASRLSSTIRMRVRQRGDSGQPDYELAATTASFTARFDASAVHLYQALHQRKADAEPVPG